MQLLKLTLDHDLYEQYKGLFLDEMFPAPINKLWNVITEAHTEYNRSITEDEVFALLLAKNGVLTTAMKNSLGELLEEVKALPAIGNDIAPEIIKSAFKSEMGRAIIESSYSLIENRECDISALQSYVTKLSEGAFFEKVQIEEVSTDLEELLKDVDNSKGWHFNIPNLHDKVPVVRAGEFGVFFARSEIGKTAFWISLSAAAGGWVDQGADVHVLCNEEYAKRNKIRSISCASGMSVEEMRQDVETASQRSTLVRNNLHMLDTQDWSVKDINDYCVSAKPDILIIDQLDKVRIDGYKDAPSHEKYGAIYCEAREIAKRHACFVIGISQASDSATGKDVIDFSMLAGSRTSKPAEADIIIGIGHNSIIEQVGNSGDVNFRLLTISKNKCSGWHGSIATRMDPLRSTYYDCEQQRE